MLAPNGMRILGGLGLANKLLDSENSIELPAIHIYESNGSLLGKIPGGSRERYKYPSVMVIAHEHTRDPARGCWRNGVSK